MAEIRPFVSIRPQRGKAAEIAALPYDVYNREEATKEVERHPQSFLSIDRAETQFPLSVDMYDDKVYERAHDTLWQWVENRHLCCAENPGRECMVMRNFTCISIICLKSASAAREMEICIWMRIFTSIMTAISHLYLRIFHMLQSAMVRW